jgi:hypothetical protein
MLKRLVPAVALAVLVASPALAQLPMKSLNDPDAKELAAYRLTVPTLNKVVVATRTMMAEMKKDPTYQDVARIETEINALEKKDELTQAEQERLDGLIAKKEALEDSMGGLSMSNARTLDDMEAQIKKIPPMMSGLNAAELSPREYSKFMLSMLQAGMVAGFKKAGMMKEIPKEVPAENVKFMEEHEAELKALQQEMQAAAKKEGGD